MRACKEGAALREVVRKELHVAASKQERKDKEMADKIAVIEKRKEEEKRAMADEKLREGKGVKVEPIWSLVLQVSTTIQTTSVPGVQGRPGQYLSIKIHQ